MQYHDVKIDTREGVGGFHSRKAQYLANLKIHGEGWRKVDIFMKANICGYTCHDKVSSARGFYGFLEVWVVPGVDDAGSADSGREGFRKKFPKLRQQGALDVLLQRARKNDWETQNLGRLGQSQRVALDYIERDIFDELHRSNLVVNEQ